MSRGMWTKHFTSDGKQFYYNATKNISMWNYPPDSIIHEAPNAKPPPQSTTDERSHFISAPPTDPVQFTHVEAAPLLAPQIAVSVPYSVLPVPPPQSVILPLVTIPSVAPSVDVISDIDQTMR